MADETVMLKWCGPAGHHSPLFGELRPGVLYPVAETDVDYFCSLSAFWQRPAAPKKKAEKDGGTD